MRLDDTEKRKFLVIVFFLAFPPLIEGGTTYIPVTVIRFFTLAVAFLFFWNSLDKGSLDITPSGLGRPIALFVVAAAAALIIAPYKYLAVQRFLGIASYIIILYIFLNALSKDNTRAALALAALIGFMEASAGIVQVYFLDIPRARGTFFNPDFFGTYLAMTAPVVLGFVFSPEIKVKWRGVAAGTGFVLMCFAALLSQSRGAFLALALSCTVYLGLRFRAAGIIAAVALAAAVFLFTPSLKARFAGAQGNDPYSYYRLRIWQNAAERVVETPWGEGLGGYSLGTQRHNFPAPQGPVVYAKLAESAHDGYLQVAVEIGVVGLAALLWGMFLLFRRVRMSLWTPDVKGLAAGLAAFFGHALVDSNFMEPALVILAVFFSAAVITLSRPDDNAGKVKIPVADRPLTRYGGLAFCMLAAVFVALPLLGWMQYERYLDNMGKDSGETGIFHLEKAVMFAPGNASYRNALASCYFSKYREVQDRALLKRSMDEVEEAIRLSPKDSYYAARRAYLLAFMADGAKGLDRNGLLSDAYAGYLKAAALFPASPYNYSEAARLAFALGRDKEAEGLLTEALRYEPNFLPARLALARRMVSAGRVSEARAELLTIKDIQQRFSSGSYDMILKKYGYQVDGKDVEYLLGMVGDA